MRFPAPRAGGWATLSVAQVTKGRAVNTTSPKGRWVGHTERGSGHQGARGKH